MFLYKIIRNIKRFINGEISTNKLISRGMRVGEQFHRGAGCFIDPTHCFLITIGNNVTMSINVTVLAHDASTEKLIGYTKIGQVHIGNNVFIGAGAIILPGVSIGDNSIIAAGSVVTHSIDANSVYGGNPAHLICNIDAYSSKHKEMMSRSRVFSENYTMRHRLSVEKKEEMINATDDVIAYIK